MNDDTLDLLAKLDDDALAPEEHARLLDTLKADPEARRTLVMHYMIGAGTGRLARVKSARRARSNKLVFPSRRLLRPVLAAAAALLIVAGIWIANRQPSAAAATAWRLADTDGRLVVTRDGRSFAAAAGTFLQDGDRLEAHDAARATLILDLDPAVGSARFLLSQDATLTLSAGAPAPRLLLESGRLEALVEPRTTAPPLTIETLHAELTVLGTRFIALSDRHSTRTRVTEGRIRMTRLSDGQSVEIEADRYAVATSDTAPIPQGIFTPNLTVGQRLLFSETFEQGWNPDLWETRYYDSRAGKSFAKDLYGSLVTIGAARRLDLKSPSQPGDRILLRPRPERIHFPNAFVLEYELEHVQSSQFGLIGMGSVVKHLYTHPQAETMIDQIIGHGRGAIHVSFRVLQSRSKTGTWIVEGVEYINGIKRQHSLLESDIPPTFAYFSLADGHVRLSNIVARELVPFEPENLAGPRLYFRETFEQGWNPEIWETAYFDKAKPRRLPENPLGPSVSITSETHGHPTSSHALEIRANGPAGSRTTVWAPLRNIRLPDSFVMEFDVFHVRPSNPAYIETGGVGEILYENPRALAMRNQHLRDRQWWRARFETRLYQTEDGLWNAEQHEFMNGVRLSHRRYTAIRHPHSFQTPLFLFFALNSGHIKLADVAVYEWTPFDAEPAPPNPTIFRESFAQGWRPHVWQTGLFNPTTRQTRVEDLLGRNVFITTDTLDPDRVRALDIKASANRHIVLRVNPDFTALPDRFVMEFDVFHRIPSHLSYIELGGTSRTLYQNPNREGMRNRAYKNREWWAIRFEIEFSNTPDGTLMADVQEFFNDELVLRQVREGIRDPRSATPPDVVLFVLESGHVMLDNIHVYANPAPAATLARADRETDAGK